jgi:ParB-like nuclease domain
MDTAIAAFQAYEVAAITPKRGKIKPVDIFSLERRETDEKTVTDLVEDLARDGSFLHPIAVRAEGASGYRLIAGHQRLEAWKRHFGEWQPIEAVIFPSHMPDARITLLDVGEDSHRKDLTAAERQAEMLRYAAALKMLKGEKLATELPVSATRGGRGKKAATAKLAAELRLTKPAVQKRISQASAAIGEKIDLDRDTPEELERKAAELEKADMRQRAEPKPSGRSAASRRCVPSPRTRRRRNHRPGRSIARSRRCGEPSARSASASSSRSCFGRASSAGGR